MVFVDRDAMHIGTTKSNNPGIWGGPKGSQRSHKGGKPRVKYLDFKSVRIPEIRYYEKKCIVLQNNAFIKVG